MKILITSGGTDVPIDDVRKISNMSSGKYGAEIAEILHYEEGHDVTYIGKDKGVFPAKNLDFFGHGQPYLGLIRYTDFFSYKDIVQTFTRGADFDMVISAAAVSDYILDKTEGKISSNNDELVIRLKRAPKILPIIRNYQKNAFLVGFKLLVSPTEEEMQNAIKKVFSNGADLVVYNDLTEIRKGDSTRYVFKPDMGFTIAKNAKELVEIILDYKNESGNTKNSNGMQA